MNKFLIRLFVTTLIALISPVSAYTATSASNTNSINKPSESMPIPAILNSDIKSDITKVYAVKNIPAIYANIMALIANTKSARPIELRKEDINKNSVWYKNVITYMFYAENFGVSTDGKTNTFRDLTKMVPYLKSLGVTNVYILPYLDSPMQDSGFDVKDPLRVRQDLGSNKDFIKFINLLHKNGIRVSGDLVLNHLSDQNTWFQEALKGDTDKLNYFVYKDYLPKENKYKDPLRGTVIDYTNKDGSVSSRRLIFPDLTPNHYRHEVINGRDYYFYHTFYPFQIDLNWENPQVLYQMLKVVGYWCNQGVDIFRLDAVPFLIKDDGTDGENAVKTHALINLISSFIQASCPNSVLQAEAGQSPQDILPYFGQEESYSYSDLNKTITIKRTKEVQIAYNFPLMPALWATMLLADNKYFWEVYNTIPAIPPTDSWANFLRVHDELTLETALPEVRVPLYNALIKNGADFRDKLGVSGRMANFLNKDPRRISQAFAILMSLPDAPVIYYGDEIGALNNPDYAHAKAIARQKSSTLSDKSADSSYFDSRDINRGPINYQSFINAMQSPDSYSGQIYTSLRHDIQLRKQYPALSSNTITKVATSSPGIFAYQRTSDSQNILVVNNLTGAAIKTSLELKGVTTSALKVLDLRSKKVIRLRLQGSTAELVLAPYQSMWLLMPDK